MLKNLNSNDNYMLLLFMPVLIAREEYVLAPPAKFFLKLLTVKLKDIVVCFCY